MRNIAMLNKLLPKRNFIRSVTLLAGGTAVGQALSILSAPLITRMYTPSDMGLSAIFSSFLSILLVVVTLRYEMAIPLPEDDEKAKYLLFLVVFNVFFITSLVAVGIWLSGDYIASLMKAPQLARYLWLIPISLFGAGIYQAFNYLMTRNGDFSLLTYTKTIQSVAQVIIQGGGGALKEGPTGLIIGIIISQMLGVGTLVRRSRLTLKGLSLNKVFLVASEYRKFPIFTTWASLINVIGLQVPTILFTSFFSMEATGNLSLTLRILALPASLIGQAVAQVLYPMIAQCVDDIEKSKKIIEKVATILLAISFPAFSYVLLNGGILFTIFFGHKWNDAGVYSQYLAPWYIFSFVSSPLSYFVYAKRRQGQALLMTIYETGSRICAILVGAWYRSSTLAILLFAIVGTLISLVYICWVLRLAGSGFIAWISKIKAQVLVGLILVSALLLSKEFIYPFYSLILDGAIISLYGLWIWRISIRSKELALTVK